MWVSVGPCSLSEDAQEIFVWHPTLHGPLSVCLCRRRQWSFSQAFGHWLGEIFTFSYIFFCRIQTKTQEEEATTTYMHSILLQLFQRPHNRTTTTTNTQIFYATRLLTIFIIYKNYYAVTTTSTTYTSYYTILLSFLKKKTFLESHKCSFFLFWKTNLVFV